MEKKEFIYYVFVSDKQGVVCGGKYFSTNFYLYIEKNVYFCTSKFEVKMCADLS